MNGWKNEGLVWSDPLDKRRMYRDFRREPLRQVGRTFTPTPVETACGGRYRARERLFPR